MQPTGASYDRPAVAERAHEGRPPAPTVLLVHEGSLRGVGDALPDGDGLGVAGVHGFHFFAVPPVPANGRNNSMRQGQPPRCLPPGPVAIPELTLPLGGQRDQSTDSVPPRVGENWVCSCVFSQPAAVNKNYIYYSKGEHQPMHF